MKLLIITQKVDAIDPVLGFFHRWLEEFASYHQIIAIALEVGKNNLPQNVKILSLGKETFKSKLKYAFLFYKYVWRERNQYEAVFVHMNQEYVLLAGWLWRLLGKKVLFWRNHPQGNWLTRISLFFASVVFCTSPESYTARYKKTFLMPVGIDTDFFKPSSTLEKKPNSILFLGRIAPVKRVLEFIEALHELQGMEVEFSATIVGSALPRDYLYEKKVRERVKSLGLVDRVQIIPGVAPMDTPKLYQTHQLYVNLTPSGSLDKTILEAMACGDALLVANKYFRDVLGEPFIANELDRYSLAKKIRTILMSTQTKNSRDFVVNYHSLKLLIKKINENLLS